MSLSLIGLTAVLGIALFFDVSTRRIPNWLILAGLIASLGCSVVQSFPLAGAGHGFLGALVGLGIFLPLYLVRAAGAGDVKLMVVAGAFIGPLQVTGAALLTLICGGVLSLVAALWLRLIPRVLGNLRLMGLNALAGQYSGLSVRDIGTTGRLPYAIAIAGGTGLQLFLGSRGNWLFA
jgi:prepilin peptidase CpaA